MKKGITLPITTLVILAISIIVLLAIVSFFMGAFGPASENVKRQQQINSCCTQYVRQGGCQEGINDLPCISDLNINDPTTQCCQGFTGGGSTTNKKTTSSNGGETGGGTKTSQKSKENGEPEEYGLI